MGLHGLLQGYLFFLLFTFIYCKYSALGFFVNATLISIYGSDMSSIQELKEICDDSGERATKTRASPWQLAITVCNNIMFP
jgi:hypothetical protein